MRFGRCEVCGAEGFVPVVWDRNGRHEPDENARIVCSMCVLATAEPVDVDDVLEGMGKGEN